MSKLPLRRLLAAASVALVTAALTGPVTPVAALEQPGVRVEEDQTVEKEYGPIPASAPAPTNKQVNPYKPDTCRTVAYCDVIPLEIVTPPGLAEADEFFVNVELSWTTMSTPGTPATNPTTVNDLDLYVWDDPQGEEEVELSATATVPEELSLYRPTKGKYQIVVVNYLGPNTGYKLKVAYKPERIVPPFESLEPDFQPPVEPVVEAGPVTPPLDLSEPEPLPLPDLSAAPVALPPSPVVAPEPVVAPPLEPVPVEPDPDFADFADSEFEEALAAPPQTDVLRERRARAVGPPEPASGVSLVLWLAIVPLALVAGGGFWLATRGSAVLRFK